MKEKRGDKNRRMEGEKRKGECRGQSEVKGRMKKAMGQRGNGVREKRVKRRRRD